MDQIYLIQTSLYIIIKQKQKLLIDRHVLVIGHSMYNNAHSNKNPFITLRTLPMIKIKYSLR